MHFKEPSHLLLSFICLHCQRMELGSGVLYAFLLFPLSCVKTNPVPDLSKTIENCYLQLIQLNWTAPNVLHLYRSAQGHPFSGHMVCRAEVNCLPRGHLNNMAENELFKKIFIAAQQYQLHLINITIQQKNMNPSRRQLHDELKSLQTQLESLKSNLQSILQRRGHSVPTHINCLPEHSHSSDRLFQQKERGCTILTAFKRYVAKLLKHFPYVSKKPQHGT